jgi:predicted DNA-binding transcriptional regulator YafY
VEAMKRSKTQAERLFDIHDRLKRQKYPNCRILAEFWEVSEKTIQRDIEFMKYRLKAPIEYDFKERGYFYSNQTFMLPAFPLSEGELVSLLMAANMLKIYEGTPLSDKLMSVWGKLSEFLPETLSVQPEQLLSQFSIIGQSSRPISEPVWTAVVGGLLTKRKLEILYHRKETRKYHIAPLHLANIEGDWYLFVRFDGHDNFRQLALSRIESARVLEEEIDGDVLFNAKEVLSTSFGRFAGDNESFSVVLEFDSEVADTITEKQWHPHQTITRLENGNIRILFKAKSVESVMGWVLAWGAHCEVIEPIELRVLVRREAEAVAQRYRG